MGEGNQSALSGLTGSRDRAQRQIARHDETICVQKGSAGFIGGSNRLKLRIFFSFKFAFPTRPDKRTLRDGSRQPPNHRTSNVSSRVEESPPDRLLPHPKWHWSSSREVLETGKRFRHSNEVRHGRIVTLFSVKTGN